MRLPPWLVQKDWPVLLRDVLKPVLSCTESTGMTVEECVACARTAASQLRHGWLRAIGAPDYQAYLAHQAQRHPGAPLMSEREYVNVFIERRYNRRGAGRCC
jgi:uncharacterized short protein YbdD (DUF466 family)